MWLFFSLASPAQLTLLCAQCGDCSSWLAACRTPPGFVRISVLASFSNTLVLCRWGGGVKRGTSV